MFRSVITASEFAVVRVCIHDHTLCCYHCLAGLAAAFTGGWAAWSSWHRPLGGGVTEALTLHRGVRRTARPPWPFARGVSSDVIGPLSPLLILAH